MKFLLTVTLVLIPIAAKAQETAQQTTNPADSLLRGALASPIEKKPEAKFGGGHGKHKVLTTGDHPIDHNDDHDFSKSVPNPDGSVCIEKTSFVEKLERQQIKECWHQNITACHFSSVTEFKSMQQKRCEENTFLKTCKITFKEVALNYTVRTCHKPLVQQCSYRHHNQRPVTVCRTWFETTCNTTMVVDAYGSHKGGQEAWCEKVPKKICAPDHCAMVEGPEECLDKNIYSTMMKPEEVCDLQPTTDCQIVTSLIPHLRQREICESVPKEFCHTKLDSPKMVKKPVTMKWCTFPTGGQLHTPHPPSPPKSPYHPPSPYQPPTPPTTPQSYYQPPTPTTPPSYYQPPTPTTPPSYYQPPTPTTPPSYYQPSTPTTPPSFYRPPTPTTTPAPSYYQPPTTTEPKPDFSFYRPYRPRANEEEDQE